MSNTSHQPPSTLCEQTQEAILALLDEEFVQEQQAVLAQHLPDCPACQAYQESMQHLTLSLRKLEEVPVPAGLESRIMSRIANTTETQDSFRPAVEGGKPPVRRNAWPKMAPIAAAIITVALSLPLLYQALNLGEPDEIGTMNQVVAQGTATPAANDATSFRFSPLENNEAALPAQGVQMASNTGLKRETANTASSSGKAHRNPDTASSSQSGDTESTEVASALPPSLNVENAYASSKEGDIYFDPVSNLVDF